MKCGSCICSRVHERLFQYPEIALRIWCLQTLKLQPATYGLVITAAGIPWACKPLVGALVDVNKRRKLAVLIASLMTILPWSIIASGCVQTAAAAGACITLSSAGLCYMDIQATPYLSSVCETNKLNSWEQSNPTAGLPGLLAQFSLASWVDSWLRTKCTLEWRKYSASPARWLFQAPWRST